MFATWGIDAFLKAFSELFSPKILGNLQPRRNAKVSLENTSTRLRLFHECAKSLNLSNADVLFRNKIGVNGELSRKEDDEK